MLDNNIGEQWEAMPAKTDSTSKCDLSVLIPARNEARTIALTLSTVVSQEIGGRRLEIIVCDNASQDGTQEAVRQWAAEHVPVRLIEEPRPGKTHAWNRLLAKASSELVFFVDADVLLAPGSLQRLLKDLEEDDQLIVIGARSVITQTDRPLRSVVNAITQPDRYQSWLVGRFYGMKKTAFRQRMESCGFSTLPDILASEDTWVSLVAGTDRWRIDQQALVYSAPYSLRELARIERRRLASEASLKQSCPRLIQSWRERKYFRAKWNELRLTKGLRSKLCTALRMPIFAALRSLLRLQSLGRPYSRRWEVSEASKQLRPNTTEEGTHVQ